MKDSLVFFIFKSLVVTVKLCEKCEIYQSNLLLTCLHMLVFICLCFYNMVSRVSLIFKGLQEREYRFIEGEKSMKNGVRRNQ